MQPGTGTLAAAAKALALGSIWLANVVSPCNQRGWRRQGGVECVGDRGVGMQASGVLTEKTELPSLPSEPALGFPHCQNSAPRSGPPCLRLLSTAAAPPIESNHWRWQCVAAAPSGSPRQQQAGAPEVQAAAPVETRLNQGSRTDVIFPAPATFPNSGAMKRKGKEAQGARGGRGCVTTHPPHSCLASPASYNFLHVLHHTSPSVPPHHPTFEDQRLAQLFGNLQ